MPYFIVTCKTWESAKQTVGTISQIPGTKTLGGTGIISPMNLYIYAPNTHVDEIKRRLPEAKECEEEDVYPSP